MLRTLTGRTVAYDDPNIAFVELSKIDNLGVTHTYEDVEVGQLLELFEADNTDFGLYQIDAITGVGGGSQATVATFTVTLIRGFGEATVGELARLKISKPPSGGNASDIYEYVDKRLEGVVSRYILKNVSNSPVSIDGQMGVSTSFHPNVTRLSFGAKDLDGGVTKKLIDGDIVEIFDPADNENVRYKVTDASSAPSVVEVEYVSGSSNFAIDTIYQVQIYPGSEEAGSGLIQVLPGNPANPQVGDAWFSTNQNTFIIKIA